MTIQNQMRKLKIHKFRKVEGLPKVDSFHTRTFDDSFMTLTVRESDSEKFFMLSSRFYIIGYTDDPTLAFAYLNNASVFTLDEIFELARGRNKFGICKS